MPVCVCVYVSGSYVIIESQVFFRELPVNVLNVLSDESIHKIARMTPQETIAEMDIVFGDTNEVVYWLLDLMVRSCTVIITFLIMLCALTISLNEQQAEIVMNEDRNKMSVKNMAIVMSPNLYAVTSENAMVALTMAQKVRFVFNSLS